VVRCPGPRPEGLRPLVSAGVGGGHPSSGAAGATSIRTARRAGASRWCPRGEIGGEQPCGLGSRRCANGVDAAWCGPILLAARMRRIVPSPMPVAAWAVLCSGDAPPVFSRAIRRTSSRSCVVDSRASVDVGRSFLVTRRRLPGQQGWLRTSRWGVAGVSSIRPARTELPVRPGRARLVTWAAQTASSLAPAQHRRSTRTDDVKHGEPSPVLEPGSLDNTTIMTESLPHADSWQTAGQPHVGLTRYGAAASDPSRWHSQAGPKRCTSSDAAERGSSGARHESRRKGGMRDRRIRQRRGPGSVGGAGRCPHATSVRGGGDGDHVCDQPLGVQRLHPHVQILTVRLSSRP